MGSKQQRKIIKFEKSKNRKHIQLSINWQCISGDKRSIYLPGMDRYLKNYRSKRVIEVLEILYSLKKLNQLKVAETD